MCYVEPVVSARYNHMDMAHLEEILKECVAKGTRQRMIVTDGVIHSVGMHENLWFAHVSRVLDDPPSLFRMICCMFSFERVCPQVFSMDGDIAPLRKVLRHDRAEGA